MKTSVCVLIVVLVCCGFVSPQELLNPLVQSDLAGLKEDLIRTKLEIIQRSVKMSESQSRTFRSLHEQYENKAFELREERIAVLRDFCNSRNIMSENGAQVLTKRLVGCQQRRVTLRETYRRHLSKAISTELASKVLQVEINIDDIVDTEVTYSFVEIMSSISPSR